MDISIVTPYLYGAGAGLMGAFLGYVKSIPKGESIDVIKAVPITIIGALAGGYAAMNGVELDTAYTFLSVSGIVALVNHVWIAVVRFYKNKTLEGEFIVK